MKRSSSLQCVSGWLHIRILAQFSFAFHDIGVPITSQGREDSSTSTSFGEARVTGVRAGSRTLVTVALRGVAEADEPLVQVSGK